VTLNVPISRIPHELPDPPRSILWDIESSGKLENTFINCSNKSGALTSISPTAPAPYRRSGHVTGAVSGAIEGVFAGIFDEAIAEVVSEIIAETFARTLLENCWSYCWSRFWSLSGAVPGAVPGAVSVSAASYSLLMPLLALK